MFSSLRPENRSDPGTGRLLGGGGGEEYRPDSLPARPLRGLTGSGLPKETRRTCFTLFLHTPPFETKGKGTSAVETFYNRQFLSDLSEGGGGRVMRMG